MVKVKVVEATQEHIDSMKGRLRKIEEKESWAIAHRTADEGLQYSFEESDICWVALVDGVPSVCWGVRGRSTMAGSYGAPWLSGTDAIYEIRFRLVRHSKEYIEQMVDKFDLLETWVDSRNEVSKVWLRWCGFTGGEAVPFGPDGMLFHRFWLERRAA